MFDDFETKEDRFEWHRTSLARLAEIEDEFMMLIQARDRLLKELTSLKETLESHRRQGALLNLRAAELLDRLARRADKAEDNDVLIPEERELINKLNASRRQLERDVLATERQLKIAQFEAKSLTELLEELEDQVAELAVDLEIEKDNAFHERN